MKTKLVLAALLSAGAAASPGPQPLPLEQAIPAPRDIAFKGTIQLAVDATDTAHKIFAVRESIPVQRPGAMVLYYPQWEAASHADTGTVAPLAGLVMRAGGKRLAWRRDPGYVFAFHVEVPRGAATLELEFQYLSPPSGATVMGPELAVVPWNRLLLYPAGWFMRNMPVRASLLLPAGFRTASALPLEHDGNPAAFKPVPMDELVDAPVFAGRHLRRYELDVQARRPVVLNVMADTPEPLDIAPAQLDKYRAAVSQVRKLFKSEHYDHYDFLASLSEVVAAGGLEHHQSAELNGAPGMFDAGGQLLSGDLFVHEYVHSWNGKFRQPADMWTPDLNSVMRDTLLWIYEGQTQFWGHVVAARAGLRTPQQTLDVFAAEAALAQGRAGRAWKSLQDSSNDPRFVAGKPVHWRDWQRREDYYGEGMLLWLDVDMRLRELTGGRRSLDDFAAAFFGVRDGSRIVLTYTFDEVCADLNRVAPYDWRGYLRNRLDAHDDHGLLDGLTRAGYRLAFSTEPTPYFNAVEEEMGYADLSYSVGLAVTAKGVARAVSWQGPAFRAGLAPGAQIVTVNGQPFSLEAFKTAIARSAEAPLELGYRQDGRTRTVRIDYSGGLRYPVLERIPGTPDRFEALLRPL
ncbi:M61 family metallopeptidase [Oxalobacteraceae bacterium A2-2]